MTETTRRTAPPRAGGGERGPNRATLSPPRRAAGEEPLSQGEPIFFLAAGGVRAPTNRKGNDVGNGGHAPRRSPFSFSFAFPPACSLFVFSRPTGGGWGPAPPKTTGLGEGGNALGEPAGLPLPSR